VFDVASPESETAGLGPSDIAGQRFSPARKGYQTDEVDAFLRKVADHVGRLRGELDWQRARSEQLELVTASAQEAAYSRMGRNFMDVVRALDEATSRIRAEAESEARRRVAAAHDEADQIVAAAKEEASALLAAARPKVTGRRTRATRLIRLPESEASGLLEASDREGRSP
jgi:DivIVA domain-containing protein